MPKVETEFPQALRKSMASLVRQGWFADESELVREAVRRFLDTHTDELMTQFVQDDVSWGLSGKD